MRRINHVGSAATNPLRRPLRTRDGPILRVGVSLIAERQYCRLATIDRDNPTYPELDPHYDFMAAIEHIKAHRANTAGFEQFDRWEPVTYKEAMASP